MSITENLPKHAQEIFSEAFNNAWDEYENPAKRYKGGNQEEVARKVAWASVKEKYEKTDKGWILKKEPARKAG